MDAIVIYCITFCTLPVLPPENTPLVPEDMLPFASSLTEFVKSPKSRAFPVDAIVIYSITLTLLLLPVLPPALTPLVDEAVDPEVLVAVPKLPKSVALPVDAIVT